MEVLIQAQRLGEKVVVVVVVVVTGTLAHSSPGDEKEWSVGRLAVTLALVFILNIFRDQPINLKWQAIIFLGGLRGAVAFMMASTYSPHYKHVQMMKIATIFIIVLTTLLNGILTKPLVVYFDLKQEKKEEELPEEYIKEYARIKETCFFRGWYWWEENVILPLTSRTQSGKGKIRDVNF